MNDSLRRTLVEGAEPPLVFEGAGYEYRWVKDNFSFAEKKSDTGKMYYAATDGTTSLNVHRYCLLRFLWDLRERNHFSSDILNKYIKESDTLWKNERRRENAPDINQTIHQTIYQISESFGFINATRRFSVNLKLCLRSINIGQVEFWLETDRGEEGRKCLRYVDADDFLYWQYKLELPESDADIENAIVVQLGTYEPAD